MTQKTSTMAAVAVAGLLTVLAPAFAQNQGQNHAEHGTMQQDHKFAMDAAQGGLMEVELGQLAEKLAAVSGAELDRMYMSHMVKDHEKDVKELEKQAQSGKDPALRSFAEQTLPTLRQHLELARSVATQVGADHGSHGSHN